MPIEISRPTGLVNPALVEEMMKRQDATEKFMPKREPMGGPTPTPLSPKMALILGSIADSASTMGFLKQGRSESNPAMKFFNKSPWSVVPTAAASAYGYGKLFDKLHKKSPRVADMVAGLVGGWHGSAAGNNVENEDPNTNTILDLDLSYGKK